MIDRATSSNSTREKLLQAAGEVFAEKGFHAATVREICRKANANIAAAHYHFGGKQRLYLAVFEHFVESIWRDYPLPPILRESVPAEVRLGAFIESALKRLLQEGRPAWLWKLAVREMSDPTSAIDLIVARLSAPLFSELMKIVRELIGASADEARARMIAASIIGQCFFYRFARPLIAHVLPQQRFDTAAIEDLARHITEFSLGGLVRSREPAAAGQSPAGGQ